MVLEYKPCNDYEVVIENYDYANKYQQWYVIQNDGYYYIANSADTDKVIAADDKATPLYLETKYIVVYNSISCGCFVHQIDSTRAIHSLIS